MLAAAASRTMLVVAASVSMSASVRRAVGEVGLVFCIFPIEGHK